MDRVAHCTSTNMTRNEHVVANFYPPDSVETASDSCAAVGRIPGYMTVFEAN